MMDRRDFLTTSSGIIVGLAAPTELLSADSIEPVYGGWIPNKQSTIDFKSQQKQPMFFQAGRNLAGSGDGNTALLWKFFEKVTDRKLAPHNQSIGDCVAQSWALGIDILDTIQVAHGRGQWITKCATETIYAGGRVEIGNGKVRGDGMPGSWAGKWCRDYGILLRKSYLGGKYDFTTYSGSKARKWAHKCQRCTDWGGGVPDELEPIAKRHPIKTITLVTSWEQARDALYNGYPVVICSNQGFRKERDADGFARRRGRWFHSLLMAGMDDSNRRPGGLLINSWGTDWISGPTRLGQPVGSFWADANTIDKMLKQGDSFAMSNYAGYPRRNLDYKMY